MDAPVPNNPPQEIWQVDAGGQIYEASFEELAQWITEGSLLRQDKVRRGNLRWIEAQKVPLLIQFFNAKDLGTTPPVVTVTNAQPSPDANFAQPINTTNIHPQQTSNIADIAATRFCLVHIETKPNYICDGCGNVFCKECPQAYGGTVRICPMCGGMCKQIEEAIKQEQKAIAVQNAVTEGFGFADFGKALVYPLKFRLSLFFGAMLFCIFTIGQHASSLGGRWLISASIMCWMLANMLTFGILSNTVENMLQGRLNQNFMPSFDDFTLWDDVIHPFFLNLGVYFSSFGAFAVLCIVMVFFVINSVSSDAQKGATLFAPELQADYGAAGQGKQQIDLVKEQLKKRDEYVKQQAESAEGQIYNETGDIAQTPASPAPVLDEEKEFQQMNEMINQTRRQQLESTIGKQTDESEFGFGSLYKQILAWALPFMALATVTFLWGIFYLPVALIVAAYTRNLGSVLNPLVGIDTIKRLGFDYVKILFFGFLLLIFSGIISMILQAVFAPFDLPRLGNLPAVAVGSLFTFYFSVVFSTVMGFALYKNIDSFNLYSTNNSQP